MITEKEKFSHRLNEALDEAGFPARGHGRQTSLAELLDVQPELVGQWLKGEAYPKTSKLVKLAKITNVRSNWLLSGVGERYSSENEEEAFREKLMQEHGKKFRARRQAALKESAGDSALSPDALEIACAYMKLPVSQQESLRKLVMDMANEH